MSATQFAGLGFELVFVIWAAAKLGPWLDRKLGTAPWMLLILVFVGPAAVIYAVYRKLMAAQARDEAARAARRNERQAP